MAKLREDIRSLTGPEKAASLLLSLPEEQATRIFAMLSEDEIREISQTMANLGTVGSGVVENLCVEFSETMSSAGSLTGSFDSTERLLAKVLDKSQVDNIMEEIRGPAGRTMWDKLNNVSESVLANYLKNEYPQTVAVVLSKVKPDHASRVLSVLPEHFAIEVIGRMLKIEHVQKEILFDVEKTLRNEFMSNLAKTNRKDSHEFMAEIFNNLDRSTENRFIGALEQTNKESADRIRALMFTFEDLIKLDSSGVQTLLRNVEKDKLGLSLKGASEAIRTLFLGNMSERAAKILKEDMDSMGPVRVKDVEASQIAIVQVAKDLASRNEILLSSNSADDDLVY
ncbi:MAG: flagellar motor switch protein FliG [Alphaproteobacteria bacterium]|nr:flagellar motor switch protein FliG [Alphaproteobacteria bacterium]MDP3532559.1 flagellar motor switch protein FliG [Alphaproteobacteria bacterium]